MKTLKMIDITARKENTCQVSYDLSSDYKEQLKTWIHLQVIELLLGHQANASQGLEVNAINHSGLTAFDLLLIFPSEAGDREIEEILRSAGATGMRDDNQTSVEQSCSVIGRDKSTANKK